MNRVNAICPNLNAVSCAARVATKLGLLLLGLTAISLITMPITQHLWTWDRFLHGGQDFETNALLILTALNLVLVLSECCKRSVGKWLTFWRRFTVLRTPRTLFEILAKTINAAPERYISPPGLASRQIPLLI